MFTEARDRAEAAAGLTHALRQDLRTRAFVFNTLLQDKATKDRLRSYPHWLASRNLANEASDESVQALIEAVQGRYDLARRLERLLERAPGAAERLDLLAGALDGAVAAVFRQIAMNRFEDAIHSERRERGELSVERLGELWLATQSDLLGDSVELDDDYGIWWSYIWHFVDAPGYVYAYAYGHLLALSVYRRYEEQGEGFVESYLELLRAGGSRPPEELGAIVGVDLSDPGFWSSGLDLIERQLDAAEAAAREAGRLE